MELKSKTVGNVLFQSSIAKFYDSNSMKLFVKPMSFVKRLRRRTAQEMEKAKTSRITKLCKTISVEWTNKWERKPRVARSENYEYVMSTWISRQAKTFSFSNSLSPFRSILSAWNFFLLRCMREQIINISPKPPESLLAETERKISTQQQKKQEKKTQICACFEALIYRITSQTRCTVILCHAAGFK